MKNPTPLQKSFPRNKWMYIRLKIAKLEKWKFVKTSQVNPPSAPYPSSLDPCRKKTIFPCIVLIEDDAWYSLFVFLWIDRS